MLRGEIRWADLPMPRGRRPVLLLSRDAHYPLRTAVTVAPITRGVRNIASRVPLDEDDGMPTRSDVNLDDLLTIEKASVLELITVLSEAKMLRVSQAIVFALDLDMG